MISARDSTIRRIALAAGLAALVSSCQTPMVMIPDDIGDRGLLVAQVSAARIPDMDRATPVIDNKQYQFGMRDGFIVIALDPGEHEFDYLTINVGSNITGSSPYGRTSIQATRTYPIKKRLRIEAGRFTSVGLLMIEPGGRTGEEAKKFRLFSLDNSADMATFLRESHPSLFASMKNRTPLVGEGPYLNAEQTRQLREAIAIDMARKRQAVNEPFDYVGGPAGTLARIDQGANGRAQVKVFDTGTLADFSRCSTAAWGAACLKSSSEYVFVKGGTLSVRQVPAGIVANSAHVFGDKGVMLIDHSMNIYSSFDGGDNWTKYAGVALAKPVEPNTTWPDPKNRFAMQAGRSGYYIYVRNMGADVTRMVYFDAAKREFTPMPLPGTVEYISAVRETDEGVFIGPSHTLIAHGKVHLLPRGDKTWTVRDVPQAACTDMALPDNRGRRLEVLCAATVVMRSEDSGMTWTRVPYAGSLFWAKN